MSGLFVHSPSTTRDTHVIDALSTFTGSGRRIAVPRARRTPVSEASADPQPGSSTDPVLPAQEATDFASPAVQSLNELLDAHNDPQLDSRLPPEIPGRRIIRDQREIIYWKDPNEPSIAQRVAEKVRKTFDAEERKRRKEIKEYRKQKAKEEPPPKYVITDYHHQLVQEMRVIIENQEGCLEQMTDLLYAKDAEIERLQYDMLLSSTPPRLSSIREERPSFGGACRWENITRRHDAKKKKKTSTMASRRSRSHAVSSAEPDSKPASPPPTDSLLLKRLHSALTLPNSFLKTNAIELSEDARVSVNGLVELQNELRQLRQRTRGVLENHKAVIRAIDETVGRRERKGGKSSGKGVGKGKGKGPKTSAPEVKTEEEVDEVVEDRVEPVKLNIDSDLTTIQTTPPSDSPKEYEKNPKSEFVDSQTLPLAVLNLYDEKTMPYTGEEALKLKYGVASYPTTDLKDQLAGPIPDQDYTRAKPPNQVQFSTFATAIEPYFRPFSEEDVSVLLQQAIPLSSTGAPLYATGKDAEISPYLVPPLGPPYTDAWAAEDAEAGIAPGNAASSSRFSPPPKTELADIEPKGKSEDLVDDALENADISCGPLASRLLSALLPDPNKKEIKEEPKEDEPASSSPPQSPLINPAWKVATAKGDYLTLEQRLKREFTYVGIMDANKKKGGKRFSKRDDEMDLMDDLDDDDGNEDLEIDWVHGREDDEICQQMRVLQKKLRQVHKTNQARKRILLPIVKEQMAYQEFRQILEDLDKQVDQAYLKRIRNPKSKKKKQQANNGSAVPQERPGLRVLLDKRNRWIDKIGPVFSSSPHDMKRVPSVSVFKDLEGSDDESDGGEFDDSMFVQ
ncbi:Chromatin-remodeling complexes subunit NGG1 [Yarrowia sp. B02]|nr:Chromatin-remodeling complexes subunit NGG1 [Yarrowia sp. B02]